MRRFIEFADRQKYCLVLGALLAVTLWFPSTREGQSLCLRWFLHLSGHTYVAAAYEYGASYDNVICEIPSDQFTDEYEQALKDHSKNSLADFARATATGGLTDYTWRDENDRLQLPRFEMAWTNSPLLPWMTLHGVEWSVEECDTNPIATATLSSLLNLTHVAQRVATNNGAFYQAEAALDFAARDNAAAIKALSTAASLTNWNAGSSNSFAYLSRLFKQAGLSELDAAFQAEAETDYAPVQNLDWQFIQAQMAQAVSQGKPKEFTRLLQLLVALRRADWSDSNAGIQNGYRYSPPVKELVEAMAVPLKTNLATYWYSDYPQSELTGQRVFQAYLSRNCDPVTVACFNSQMESFKTEHRLREQIKEIQGHGIYRWFERCQISGSLSLLMLSLLCAGLFFEAVVWKLKNQAQFPGKWPGGRQFWVLSLIAVIGGTLLLIRLELALNWVFDFGPGHLSWFVNPLSIDFLLTLLIFSAWLWVLMFARKKGRLLVKPRQTSCFFLLAYLVCVLAMAFCRSQLVANINSQYQ